MSAAGVSDQVGYIPIVGIMLGLAVTALIFGVALWPSGTGNAWMLLAVFGICPAGITLMHVTRSTGDGVTALAVMMFALSAALMANSSI